MKPFQETRTAVEVLQESGHRKVKSLAQEHSETACALFDVLAGNQQAFSLCEWHQRIESVLNSGETVAEWLARHPVSGVQTEGVSQ